MRAKIVPAVGELTEPKREKERDKSGERSLAMFVLRSAETFYCLWTARDNDTISTETELN